MLELEGIEQLQLEIDDTVAALVEQISFYSGQIEQYDRSNADFAMTCIGFAGVVFGIIITLLLAKEKQKQKLEEELKKEIVQKEWIFGFRLEHRQCDIKFHPRVRSLNRAISILFLTLPSITMLFLYVFSMQSRRVAIFRGYLWYLEEELTKNVNTNFLFNFGIAKKFIGGSCTNFFGPIVMVVFVICILAVSFRFSFSFSNFRNEWKEGSRSRRGLYIILYKILPCVCIFFCTICIIDLVINDNVTRSVYQYCIENTISK